MDAKHGSWGLFIHSNREAMGAVKREVGHSGKLYSAFSRLYLCAMGWSPVTAGSCRGIQKKRQLWLREMERYIADELSDTSTDSDRRFKCKMSYLVLVDFLMAHLYCKAGLLLQILLVRKLEVSCQDINL